MLDFGVGDGSDRVMIGYLRKNENGRFEIVDCQDPKIPLCDRQTHELNSGSIVDVLIGGVWIRTRIEHGRHGYFAVEHGVQLCEGIKARLVR